MKNIPLIHFILEGYFQSFSFRLFRAGLDEFVESVCFDARLKSRHRLL